jgi:hypothetical protein
VFPSLSARQFVVSTTKVSPSHLPTESPLHRRTAAGRCERPSVRNHASFAEHLGRDHHMVVGLHNPQEHVGQETGTLAATANDMQRSCKPNSSGPSARCCVRRSSDSRTRSCAAGNSGGSSPFAARDLAAERRCVGAAPRSARIERRRIPVLHDPLMTDDAQITGAIGGAAAKGKQANECERRNRDHRECAFRKMQGHSPLAMRRQHARQVRDAPSPQIVSGGRRVSHVFDLNTIVALPATAQIAWLSRIVIHSGI